jgi:hypothetical protein
MPSHHPYRRHLRQQQVHVRSHHDTRPLGVGNDTVQWVEYMDEYGHSTGYFYRPMDQVDFRRSYHESAIIFLREARALRRQGKPYHLAKSMVDGARALRLEAAK